MIPIMLLLLLPLTEASAKNDKKLIRQGNKEYHNENFQEAELKYRKAGEINADNYKADFNLADALYKKEAYSEAAGKFEFLKDKVEDKKIAADVAYNLGNSYFMQAKKASESQDMQAMQMSMTHMKKAVEAFKDALRKNPADNDARHNYELAKRVLEQQQQQQQQQQQNKQNQDKQNQDKQDQNKDGEQKDKQDQNKQDQNKDGRQKDSEQKQGNKGEQDEKNKEQQQQAEPKKMSKEEAEKMLKALQQKEKGTIKKMKRQKVKKTKIEKNW